MSAFRPIRPSENTAFQKDESASDTSTQPSSAGLGGLVDISLQSTKGRKRRAPAHVSQNACTNCKKARAKCDGEEPAACSRCIGRDVADQCHYEVHVKTVKEEMIRRIKNLEQRNQELEDSVKEGDRRIDAIVKALLNDEKGAEAIDRLKRGESHQELDRLFATSPFATVANLSPTSRSFFSNDVVRRYEESMDLDGGTESSSAEEGGPSRWTNVTPNDAVTHHLMALYFAWVHPVYMLFSEKHFTLSLQNRDSTYCTPAMVNAICAMGCFLHSNRKEDDDSLDAQVLGERLLRQLRRDIDKEDRRSPSLAITYAILFLVELSAGQARNASSHLRLAAESLRHVEESSYAKDAMEIATWGIHTLNTDWAAFTYQKPAAPVPLRAKPLESIEMDGTDAFWQPYRFPYEKGADELPGYAVSTAKASAQLTRCIHETINLYCGSRGKVTAGGILDLYGRYLNWKSNLPPEVTLNEKDGQPLPHIISLHIHYHVAICQLFLPLVDCGQFSPAACEPLVNITIESAQSGFELIQRYRQLYSNRYQPPLQAFSLVHLCEILLRADTPRKDQTVAFCLGVLQEASPGFPFVRPLQAMFCERVAELGVPLPENLAELLGGQVSYGLEAKLDVCERVTYTQPVDMLVDRLDPDIAADFEVAWRAFLEQHGGGGTERPGGLPRPPPRTSSSGDCSGKASPASRSMKIQEMVNP